MINKNDFLKITPMKEYNTPSLPTLEESKPELLKKVLLHWKNKAIIAAVTGLLGMVIFSGCSIYEGLTATNEQQLCGLATHQAFLAEQEVALVGIIKSQLEAAGLDFDESLQSYYIQIEWAWAKIVLVNEDLDLRIALVNYRSGSEDGRLEFIENVGEQFIKDFGIDVDAFFFSPADGGLLLEWSEESRAEFEADLAYQVQGFIEELREDGVIE